MGWSSGNRLKQPVKDFIIDHVFSWPSGCGHRSTVLDCAIVNLRTFYAAVERIDDQTGERTVWASVVLLDYGKKKTDSHDFGWKSLSENEGPNQAACPARILDLLTPTANETALAWRAACRSASEAPRDTPQLGPGCSLTLFGKRYCVLKDLGRRGWLVSGPDGEKARIKRTDAGKCADVIQPATSAPPPPPSPAPAPVTAAARDRPPVMMVQGTLF